MDMKGNFAPYMDIENEYPELKEFFGKDQISAKPTNGIAAEDSGEATLKVEKNGILTVQNEYVEHVPVTV